MHESITVSALNRYAKALLETDEVLSQIWVEGEISGLKIHQASGHMYFALKDAQASVAAVMWSSSAARLRFVVKDGMYVVARCKVSLYERDGRFQLYVDDLVPMGVGTAQQQLDALRDKLSKEGLFSAERKRPLVRFPKRIAVITSPGAAALQDIINVTARRYPFVKLLLFPAAVQGQLAVRTIVEAIEAVCRRSDIDEVIIARGGGSKEDLYYFNSEEIVRAAAKLPVPFISAVGHEVDTTLLDYAADARAATPSVAAELAVPDAAQLLAHAQACAALCGEAADRICARASEDCAASWNAAAAANAAFLREQNRRLAHTQEMLDSLNPARVLSRGYAGVYKDGRAVSDIAQLSPGDDIRLALGGGTADCTVCSVKEGYDGSLELLV
ncbi:MAG: exodeoxyribonuclease VII large subunit [Oscillospiraceae bacterium]|nr:exodeoxyribonuclease VII large subunit [Oscillospiraceae bacterium]